MIIHLPSNTIQHTNHMVQPDNVATIVPSIWNLVRPVWTSLVPDSTLHQHWPLWVPSLNLAHKSKWHQPEHTKNTSMNYTGTNAFLTNISTHRIISEVLCWLFHFWYSCSGQPILHYKHLQPHYTYWQHPMFNEMGLYWCSRLMILVLLLPSLLQILDKYAPKTGFDFDGLSTKLLTTIKDVLVSLLYHSN